MRITSLFLPLAIVASTSTALAQSTCASPAVLTCDSQAFFYNTGSASASGLNPGCGGSNPVDLWYEITPTGSGPLDVTTCGSIYDTRLAIWADDCSTVLACNDDDNSACPGQSSSLSRVTINATAGTTYRIQVGGFNGAKGAGVLNVDPPCSSGPPNDDCANAEVIVGCGYFNFDNTSATTDGPTDALCNQFGSDQIENDVWYSWDAPLTGTFIVQTCGGTTLNTRMAVLDSTGTTTLACNDDTCSLQSSVGFSAVLGTNYKIRIGSFSSGDFGSGAFNISPIGTQNYCSSGANGATIALTPGASTSVAANNFSLDANGLPDTNGIFYYGTNQASLPFGGGFTCVSGSTYNIFILGTPVGGTRTLAIDLNQAPATNITPGSCWNFQYLFRDRGVIGGFDLTDGLSVVFQ